MKPDRFYTLLLSDRTSGVVRRVTFRRRPVVTAIAMIVVIPVLIGLGARWSATSEIARLQTSNAALGIENQSYRAATSALTTQIQSLEGVVNQVDEKASLDLAPRTPKAPAPKAPATRPASQTNSALGNVLSTISSPEDLFGVLREILQGVENRLRFARGEADKAPK